MRLSTMKGIAVGSLMGMTLGAGLMMVPIWLGRSPTAG